MALPLFWFTFTFKKDTFVRKPRVSFKFGQIGQNLWFCCCPCPPVVLPLPAGALWGVCLAPGHMRFQKPDIYDQKKDKKRIAVFILNFFTENNGFFPCCPIIPNNPPYPPIYPCLPESQSPILPAGLLSCRFRCPGCG
jgi:hypothetical protein